MKKQKSWFEIVHESNLCENAPSRIEKISIRHSYVTIHIRNGIKKWETALQHLPCQKDDFKHMFIYLNMINKNDLEKYTHTIRYDGNLIMLIIQKNGKL